VPPGAVRELGCGLGLVGVALARLGWQVEATDYVEAALMFATHNARANQAGLRHGTAYLDWRHPAGRPLACAVAADVVYEKQNHAHLNRVLDHLLLPGGRFFLADPQRPAARHFVSLLQDQGYAHQVETRPVRWRSLEHRIDIHTFTKPPGPAPKTIPQTGP
jgi:predicted nicotinamide N-methyase